MILITVDTICVDICKFYLCFRLILDEDKLFENILEYNNNFF